MLSWFDGHPAAYWWIVYTVIAVGAFLVLWPLRRLNLQDDRGSDRKWAGVILLILAAGRWPTWFVSRQFNEDESQFIAGALTLRHDPVFWRAVDGGTAGPLDYYALFPAGWLNGVDTFGSARITAFLLIAVALIAAHQSLALIFGRNVARISSFGATCLEALTVHEDLIHYSSELVAVALLSLGFLAGTRRLKSDRYAKWNILGGLALGFVPFSKLQAAPIAFFVGLFWVGAELFNSEVPLSSRTKPLLYLVGAAFIPTLCIAAGVGFTGQWENALTSYLRNTLVYAQASDMTTGRIIGELWEYGAQKGALFVSAAGGFAAWLGLTLMLKRHVENKRQQLFAWGSLLFLLLSLMAIVAPLRPFLHYCQLSVVPAVLVFGAVLGLVASKPHHPNVRRATLCGALVFGAGPLIYERGASFHPHVGQFGTYQQWPRGLVATEVLKYARRGESAAVWGWTQRIYPEAGLRQATRDANSTAELFSGPYQTYFRQRYISDLRASRPPVFIDAVSPTALVFKDPRYRHDAIFPELAGFIQGNYTLVGEPLGSRLYVRNDRLAEVMKRPLQFPANRPGG